MWSKGSKSESGAAGLAIKKTARFENDVGVMAQGENKKDVHRVRRAISLAHE
jgi:hypothetical protein